MQIQSAWFRDLEHRTVYSAVFFTAPMEQHYSDQCAKTTAYPAHHEQRDTNLHAS